MGKAIDLQTPAVLPALGEPEDPDFLETVKETLELWRSERGDPLDAVVTKRFLFEKGLIDVFVDGVPTSFEGAPIDPNLGQGGSIPAGGVTVATPTIPTSVVATAIVLGAIITWDAPSFGGYKHTEVWRSNDNDLDNATLIGTSSIATFTDNVGLGGVTRYYWVRHVNLNDIPGAFHAGQTAGEQIITLLGGEANTSSNVGIGEGNVFKAKVGVDLQFKTLLAGDDIDIQDDTDEVVIGMTAFAQEIDVFDPTTIYRGEAQPGTLTSAAAWRVRRFIEAPDGDISTKWADGDNSFDNIWDNRTSLTYS